MKELSIEEKAQRYDEAIEIAKKINNEQRAQPFNVMTRVFPELKESEDERMLNQLHSWMKEFGGAEEYTEKVYQWIKGLLEKEGEQKSVDKVEPKFKVGDWVVHNMSDGRKAIRQIVKMTNKSYVLDGGGFDTFYFNDLENDYHIWTIQDAKDGDVLAFYSEYRSYKMVQVGIIEKYVGKHGGCSNTFKIYVGVNWDNNLQIGQYMGCSDIHPATKEQRDTLMETMADDGYTFDFEKKELKKIEQNSIEPDDLIEESYRKQADDVIDMVTEKPANIIQEDFEKYVEHLLSLSDGEGHGSPAKVKEVCYELLRLANLQQKPWSEEDENAFDSILNDLRQGVIPDDEDMNWLKSLKDR